MPEKVNKEAIKKKICWHIARGCTKTASYGGVGIAKRTFYDWVNDDPAFKAMVDKALAKARLKVETKLVKSALDGDRLLLMFYLQNRYPDDWKDTRKIQVDQHTTLEDKRIDSLSDEEIFAELEAAGIDCGAFKKINTDAEDAEGD